jgi:hypothetical protein
MNLDISNDELTYLIQIRALSYREWIHRPFLYYVIHCPADDIHIPRVMPLAIKCLEFGAELILMSQSHHRHHGTWYTARTSTTPALLLLAGARSKRIELPQRWKEAMNSSLKRLQIWGTKAFDLQRAANILELLVRDTDNLLLADRGVATPTTSPYGEE